MRESEGLSKVAERLDANEIPFEYVNPDDWGMSPFIRVMGANGNELMLFGHGPEVYMHGSVPPECALMAVMGTERYHARDEHVRKLLRKQFEQAEEIENLEQFIIRTAILWCGYAEGE